MCKKRKAGSTIASAVPLSSILAVIFYFICHFSGFRFRHLGVVLTVTLAVLLRNVLTEEPDPEEDITQDIIMIVGDDFSKATRMQYHVLSMLSMTEKKFLRKIGRIDVIAYACQSKCIAAIQKAISEDRVVLHLYSDFLRFPSCFYLIAGATRRILNTFPGAPVKFPDSLCRFIGKFGRYFLTPIMTSIWLLYTIFVKVVLLGDHHGRLKCLFVSNPPSIPILPVSQLCALMFSRELIVDWHNIGSTLFGYSNSYDRSRNIISSAQSANLSGLTWQRLKNLNIPFFIHFCLELAFGKGDVNIVVSERMGQFITDVFSMSVFERMKYAFLVSTNPSSEIRKSESRSTRAHSHSEITPTVIVYHDRPLFSKVKRMRNISGPREETEIQDYWMKLIFSANWRFYCIMSCSWSKDDDVQFLYDAILALLKRSRKYPEKAPSMHVIVTGTGLKHAAFLEMLEKSNFPELRPQLPLKSKKSTKIFYTSTLVSSVYFQSYDSYIEALSQCHVGLCVHRSSSTVDLPMKILEYYTCGIPAIALEYDGIREVLEIKAFSTEESTRTLGWAVATPAKMAQRIVQCAEDWLPYDLKGDCSERVRQNIRETFAHKENCWEHRWNEKIAPLLVERESEGQDDAFFE